LKVGSGDLQYELIEDWEQLPAGYSHPDVASVCTDASGRVYLLCRGEHPVMVYEPDGRFVESWGEGRFTLRTHGMTMGPNGDLFVVDDAAHHVGQYSLSGELIRNIGPSGKPSDTGYDGTDILGETVKRAGGPFNRPTNVAQNSNGDIYVSDGYGNCQVHQFTDSGELTRSWGQPGSERGQFRLVHDIAVHPDGRIFVADSSNDRLQIFSATGEFIDEWLDVQRPRGIHIDADGRVYVGELVWRKGQRSLRRGVRNAEEPARMSIYDSEGVLILRWGDSEGSQPGHFVAPHGIWVDRDGSIFVAEVTQSIGVNPGFVPSGTHTFQKFGRL
jgi:DNA-binding beta-propeller fold protein YncE